MCSYTSCLHTFTHISIYFYTGFQGPASLSLSASPSLMCVCAHYLPSLTGRTIPQIHCACVYIQKHCVYMNICVSIYVSITLLPDLWFRCICVYMFTSTCLCVCICIYVCIGVHKYVYIHTHTYTHTHNTYTYFFGSSTHECVHISCLFYAVPQLICPPSLPLTHFANSGCIITRCFFCRVDHRETDSISLESSSLAPKTNKPSKHL